MSRSESLSFRASLEAYEQQAQALFSALKAGDESAQWRVKWEHPRFRGKSVEEVKAASLEMTDARQVIAHEYAFDAWADLASFTEVVKDDGAVSRFEAAVEAVVAGDASTLKQMIAEHPDLVRAHSTRRHHVTLLHYLGANGVEGGRQKTPANAVEIARILLDAGAEVDALADLYDQRCTTMSMLVSSCHPAEAGLQIALAETLVDYGAALDGKGTAWQSAVMTALMFGYLDTARVLAKRTGPLNDLTVAAGLGHVEEAVRLLPSADARSKHAALALAAQHGHVAIVQKLLDAGEDPNRYNPEGFHSHSAPLHQAVAAGHLDVVRILVERGARLDLKDTVYGGTPLGWAIHCNQPAIAEFLRGHNTPSG